MTDPALQRAGLLCRGSACRIQHLCVFQSRQHPEALDMKINGDVSVCVLEQTIILLFPIRNPHATPVTFYHIHTSRILTLLLKWYLFPKACQKKKKKINNSIIFIQYQRQIYYHCQPKKKDLPLQHLKSQYIKYKCKQFLLDWFSAVPLQYNDIKDCIPRNNSRKAGFFISCPHRAAAHQCSPLHIQMILWTGYFFGRQKSTQCNQCSTNWPHLCFVVVVIVLFWRNYAVKYFV